MASTSLTTPPSSPSRGPSLPSSPSRPVGAAQDLAAMRLVSRDLPARTRSGESLQETGSPFGSPARKRKPAEPFGTPSPVKALRDRLCDMREDLSLDRTGQAVVGSALQALRTLPDTPERCVRARKVSSLIEKLAESVLPSSSVQREEAPPSRRTCIGLTEEETDNFSGSWSEKALAELNRIYARCRHRLAEDNPLLVVNLGHLVQPSLRGQVAVGLHMSSPESQKLEKAGVLETIASNPLTGVRAVKYQAPGSKKPKISTFFPEAIRRPEDLLAILGDGEIIRQDGERCLMALPRERYHVELYLHSSFHVRSCFPVFYYAPFDPGAPYHITEAVRHSADDILNYCRRAAETNTVYRTETTVTIDIGPVMDDRNCPVRKGIYIEIDPALL